MSDLFKGIIVAASILFTFIFVAYPWEYKYEAPPKETKIHVEEKPEKVELTPEEKKKQQEEEKKRREEEQKMLDDAIDVSTQMMMTTVILG